MSAHSGSLVLFFLSHAKRASVNRYYTWPEDSGKLRELHLSAGRTKKASKRHSHDTHEEQKKVDFCDPQVTKLKRATCLQPQSGKERAPKRLPCVDTCWLSIVSHWQTEHWDSDHDWLKVHTSKYSHEGQHCIPRHLERAKFNWAVLHKLRLVTLMCRQV